MTRPSPSRREAARISVSEAAGLLGVSARKVRKWASEGRIPGAAKLLGKVTFDRERLEGYIRRGEEPWANPICIAEAKFGTSGQTLTAKKLEEAYTQLMSPPRGKRETSGSRSSRRPRSGDRASHGARP